jgi:ABC-type polysaccharide/polyol phosphate transport system ATPase subunit
MTSFALSHVDVEFPIYTPKSKSITSLLTGRVGGAIERNNNITIVKALSDVTFSCMEGDRLGLVGHNGAGKTTLLRVIAGIYPPVSGEFKVSGSVSALTDMMLGMDMEATGRENIIFRCIFLGMTFAEAREALPEIAAFTQLEHFLDTPIRTYSTGMIMRLAFSVATAVRPDILVMDEMISAGDPEFMKQAETRVNEMLGSTKILVLGTQVEKFLKDFCNRAILLEHGTIKDMGPVDRIWSNFVGSR